MFCDIFEAERPVSGSTVLCQTDESESGKMLYGDKRLMLYDVWNEQTLSSFICENKSLLLFCRNVTWGKFFKWA